MEGSDGGCDVGGGVGEGGDCPTALLKQKTTPSIKDNSTFAWKYYSETLIITRGNECSA